MKLKWLVLLFLLLPLPLLAQTGAITGVALDSVGNTVAGATITVCVQGSLGIPCSPITASTTSNGQGAFSVTVPVGTYTVTVFRSGVVATSSTIVVAPSNITVANNVTYTGAVSFSNVTSLTVSGTGTFSGPLVNTGTDSGNQTISGNKTLTGQTSITNPCTMDGFIYVSTGGCYTTIAQAIAAFSGGNCGTIYLPVGTFTQNITVNSSNACSNASSQMIIQGSGRRSTILKPASNAAVITLDSTAAAIQSVSIRDCGFDNTGSGFTQPAILISGGNINDHHEFRRLWFKGFTDTLNITGRTIWDSFDNLEIINDADVPINVNTGTNAFNFNKFHHLALTGSTGLWNILLNCTGGANCGGSGTYIDNVFDFVDMESPGGVSTGGISLVNTDRTEVNLYCESLNGLCLSVTGAVGRGLSIRGFAHNNTTPNLFSFTAAQLSGVVCGVSLAPTGGGLSYVQTTSGSGNGLFFCPGNFDTGSHTISADSNGSYHTTIYGAYPPTTLTSSGSITPSVAGINHLHFQNTVAATITNFTGGDPGQNLVVFNEGTSTITFTHGNTGAPFMPNGVSVTIANGGSCTFFYEPLNTRWVNTSCISGQATGNAFGANTLTLKKGSGAGNYGPFTNTSYVNVDTTNLCFAVTVPTGWKLAISSSGGIQVATASAGLDIALFDIGTTCGGVGTTTLIESRVVPANITQPQAFALNWVLTGDGAAHAISLQAHTENAADAWVILNSTATIAPTIVFTLMPSN